jgi:nuclease S1
MATRLTYVFLFLIFFASAPSPSLAWGVEGHRIIAYIAAKELTSAARAQVQDLLRGDAESVMVEASTWADDIRPRRSETAQWHFVDIPIASTGFNASRDCPKDNCIVAQIEREKTILGDRQLTTAVRAEALRFMIHFVGDIHQPLHAADNGDRGGNTMRVSLGGKGTNLHAVWDTAIVQSLGVNAGAVADDLIAQVTQSDRKAWQDGGAVDWANESWRLARMEIYAQKPVSGGTRAPIILPSSYSASEGEVVRTQLEKAGERLAWLLNRVLH